MLGAPEDAAEATQETFLRMLQRLPVLDGRELNFAAYLLKIARNVCYDAIEARRRVALVAEHEDLPLDGPLNVDEDPERAARCCGHARRARAANASLPPRRREVVALRELESLPYAQIGEIVGLKENAVAQLISRARVGLRNAVPTRFRGRALQSVGPATDECGRALPLLATVQDGQDGGGAGAPARVRGGGAGAGRAHSRGIGPCRPCEALRRRRGSSVRARSPTRAAAGPPNWDCVGAPAGGHRRR